MDATKKIPGTVTYSAWWNRAESSVTVTRDVVAGISGPWAEFRACDELAIVVALANLDLALSGEWSEETPNGCQISEVVSIEV